MAIYLPTTLPIPETILRVDTDPQFIFAQLVKFGREHKMPTYYLGDLYHDALYLRKYHAELLKDGYFYYGVRTCGTSIGQEYRFIGPYNEHAALCILPTVAADDIKRIEDAVLWPHSTRNIADGRMR